MISGYRRRSGKALLLTYQLPDLEVEILKVIRIAKHHNTPENAGINPDPAVNRDMSDKESEPLTMQLVRDGVESEAAYQAATELEKTRLEAERQQAEYQTALEIVLQEIDVADVLESVIKAASTAALTGQQAGQQPQVVRSPQPAEKPSQGVSQPDTETSPLREEVESEMRNDGD